MGNRGGGGGGRAENDADAQALIDATASKFQQFTYDDEQTGSTLEYSLFVPEGAGAGKALPLVMFIPDSTGAATQLAETRRVQANIEQGYVADMTKYAAPQDIPRIFEAWSSIPRQLAKKNHKFQYKAVASGGRASRYESALAWLRSAGVVASCTQVSEGVAPLAAFEDPGSFKLYMADTGLLASTYSARPEDLMPSEGKAAGFRGAIAENYCLQQLASAGVTCHYWGTTSKSEVEFVARSKDGSVIPIEVKSGKNVRSNSLQKYRESYRPPFVVRASARNFGFENGVRSIPLYALRAFADELDPAPSEQLLL